MSDHLLGRLVALTLLPLIVLAALSACSASGGDDTHGHYQNVRADLCERLRVTTLIEPDSIEIERLRDDRNPDGSSASCAFHWTDTSAERNDGSVSISLRVFDTADDARTEFERLDSAHLTLAPDNWKRIEGRTSTTGWWTENSNRTVSVDEPGGIRDRHRRFQLYLDENLIVVIRAFHDLATPAPRHTNMEVGIIDALVAGVPEQVG